MSCTKNSQPVATARSRKFGEKKPIVLSSQRYNKLLNNANQSEKLRVQRETEEDLKYREYLLKGSNDLVVQFKGNMPRTQDSKLEEMKNSLARKQKKADDGIKQAKENEEAKRREKIATAEKLLEKLKPGPRSLHTAAVQSEILRVRNVQRNILEEFQDSVKKQACADKLACKQQALPWVQEEQQRLVQRQQRTNNYKQELLKMVNETSKQRTDYKRKQIKDQQAARAAMDMEIQEQIDKETAIMDKKRETLRKNALEAMKMVEQRRQRDRMVEEVEDRMCCVYNTGKRELDVLKAEHAKQTADQRTKACGANAEYSVSIKDNVQAIESERLRRDISVMELKFTAEEREKIRKDKAAKQARIEAYLYEQKLKKEEKHRAEEQKRFEMAQRFKNDEVNCLFAQSKRDENARKYKNVRVELEKQIEEKKRIAQEEKAAELLCTADTKQEEDRHFFEVARSLLEETQQKGRPLYPLVKAVQQYKRENQIDCGREIPKHLVSHLKIGCRQPGDSNADTAMETKQKGDESYKQSITENCLKISEIISKANSSPEAATMDGVNIPGCASTRARSRKEYKADGLAECASLLSATASTKQRYSMNELKQLNYFADSYGNAA